MLKNTAIVFGIIFIITGVLGFIPQITPKDELFGIFHVNFLHNIVHLLTGIIALWAAFSDFNSIKLFFQIFGIVYGLVAISGFYYGNEAIFGILANNFADSTLHMAIAAISLYLGFVYQD